MSNINLHLTSYLNPKVIISFDVKLFLGFSSFKPRLLLEAQSVLHVKYSVLGQELESEYFR